MLGQIQSGKPLHIKSHGPKGSLHDLNSLVVASDQPFEFPTSLPPDWEVTSSFKARMAAAVCKRNDWGMKNKLNHLGWNLTSNQEQVRGYYT